MSKSDMPELHPAFVKAIARAAADCLGADHEVAMAFGFAIGSSDPATVDRACKLFVELPAGQRNTIWLTAKSRLVGARKGVDLYSDGDLSPDRTIN